MTTEEKENGPENSEGAMGCAERYSPFVSFIRDRSIAYGAKMRVVVVDYLNVMIGGMFRARDAVDLCAILSGIYTGMPIIIVTKHIGRWKNDNADNLIALSVLYPNVMYVVCLPVCSKIRRPVRICINLLAEADDHLIAMLTLSISACGCAPIVLSRDQYRNSAKVFNGIPSYKYATYCGGTCVTEGMRAGRGNEWIARHSAQFAEWTIKCSCAHTGKCLNCAGRKNAVCNLCHVCTDCNSNMAAWASNQRTIHFANIGSNSALEEKWNDKVAAECKNVN
jgi:hypothetical protein